MKKLSLFFILSFSFVMLPAFLAIPSGEAVAQEEEQRKTKKVGAMTEKVAIICRSRVNRAREDY